MGVVDFCAIYGYFSVHSWTFVATSLNVHSLLEGHLGDVE